jgi:hypothetical protein
LRPAAGYFADPAEEGRRFVWTACFDTTGTSNVARLRSSSTRTVVRLIDSGAVGAAAVIAAGTARANDNARAANFTGG